jgi:hypothetical protein
MLLDLRSPVNGPRVCEDGREMGSRIFVAAAAVAALATLATLASAGCKSEDPAKKSRRGESCQVSGDCGDGLACQPLPQGGGGTCVIASFGIAATGKECALVECTVTDDCCPNAPDDCNAILALCTEDAGPPSTNACQQYQAQCLCQAGRRSCEANTCVSHCATDDDCSSDPSGAFRCAGASCVQCTADTQCQDGASCTNGRCRPPCDTDGDCPGFKRCLDHRCIDSGCQTDRECVAATSDVEAVCGTDGKCITPCETDLECGSPKNYKFFSCVGRQCVPVGCESDKDCRILLTGTSDDTTLPDKEHVVCREKPPGD